MEVTSISTPTIQNNVIINGGSDHGFINICNESNSKFKPWLVSIEIHNQADKSNNCQGVGTIIGILDEN